MRIRELIEYGEKSKIKAGDAVLNGKYPLFTSSEAEDKRYDQYTCDAEGIIMGTGGNATLHYCKGKFAVSTDCLVLKPNHNIKCKYLFYFFKANMNILQDGFKGAGLKHTNKNYIGNIELNRLPDIKQQLEIICKLDKIETIIKKHQKLIEKLDMLIKSQFISMFGDPITNSQNRPQVRFDSVVKLQRGYDLPISKREENGKIPIYGSNGIVGFHNISKSKNGIVTGRSGTIGKVFYVNGEYWPLNTSLFSINTFNNDIVFLSYLVNYFNLARFYTGSGVPTLNRNNVHKELIYDIPLNEQKEFSKYALKCDKLKIIAQKSLNKSQMLFDSLMQKYFT